MSHDLFYWLDRILEQFNFFCYHSAVVYLLSLTSDRFFFFLPDNGYYWSFVWVSVVFLRDQIMVICLKILLVLLKIPTELFFYRLFGLQWMCEVTFCKTVRLFFQAWSMAVVEITCTLLSVRALPWTGLYDTLEIVDVQIAAEPLGLCATALNFTGSHLQIPTIL